MPSIRHRLSQKPRQPDMFTSLALGSAVAFLIQGTGAGILYLSQILFARWMGPVEYGAYAFAFSWAQLLAALSGLGFTTAVLRFIPQYLSGRDWERLRGVIFRSRQLTFLTGVVIAAIGTLVLLLLQPRSFNTITLIFGMLLVPLFASLNLHTEMLRGTRHIALAYAPPMLLQPILATGAGFLILRATGTLTSVYTMSVVAMAFLVALVAQVLSLKHVLPKEAANLTPTYETAEWLRISFPLLLVEGFASVLRRADILMIGMFIGQKEAGIYEAAAKTAMLASFFLTTVNAAAAPMIASLHARGDHASLQGIVTSATRWMWFPSFVIALAVIFLASPILGLFGPVFAEGRWALRLLALGQLINASAGPVGYLLGLTGYQNLSARVLGITAMVNIVLNATLIPFWGLEGAALATMGTMILWNVWLYILVKKHLGIRSFVFSTVR